MLNDCMCTVHYRLCYFSVERAWSPQCVMVSFSLFSFSFSSSLFLYNIFFSYCTCRFVPIRHG